MEIYFHGVISAIIQQNLDSKKMREGLYRKLLLIIAMLLGFVIQFTFFNMEIISKGVCLYIIFMEIVSILENLQKAGINFGEFGKIFNIKEDENDKNN